MNKEQKAWFEYGRLKAAWLITKKLEPGSERVLTQTVWDAHKKAHAWLLKGDCECCKHSYTAQCNNCLYNQYEYHTYLDNWEPKNYD